MLSANQVRVSPLLHEIPAAKTEFCGLAAKSAACVVPAINTKTYAAFIETKKTVLHAANSGPVCTARYATKQRELIISQTEVAGISIEGRHFPRSASLVKISDTRFAT